MTDALPRDLTPISTQPWNERPLEIPLEIEECRTALWMCRGNVTEAATVLKVPSDRLRRLIKGSRRLQDTVEESRERLKDLAESNLYDALTDGEDPQRRDSMTKYVLSNLGQDRGFGSKAGININTGNSAKGRLMVVWDDGETLTGSPEPTTIEGEVINE